MITLQTHGDPYGKAVIEGRTGLFTERRIRKLRQRNKNLVRVPKNGLYDPMCYYHLMDILCQTRHFEEFDAKELTEILNKHKPMFRWDVRTVGRIISDIWESLEMASPAGQCPIRRVNHSNHIYYSIQRYGHTDTMLLDTLLDLGDLCETTDPEKSYEEIRHAWRSPLEFVDWLNPPM